MNLKIVWIPLMLFIMTSTAIARADRLKPSKLDLKIRALILEGDGPGFSYERPGGNSSESDQNSEGLSKKDVKLLSNSLYLLPRQVPWTENIKNKLGSKGRCYFFWYITSPSNPNKNLVQKLQISFNIGEAGSECVLIYPNRHVIYRLRSVTVKRWMELIVGNPRTGPKIRAMMRASTRQPATAG